MAASFPGVLAAFESRREVQSASFNGALSGTHPLPPGGRSGGPCRIHPGVARKGRDGRRRAHAVFPVSQHAVRPPATGTGRIVTPARRDLARPIPSGTPSSPDTSPCATAKGGRGASSDDVPHSPGTGTTHRMTSSCALLRRRWGDAADGCLSTAGPAARTASYASGNAYPLLRKTFPQASTTSAS